MFRRGVAMSLMISIVWVTTWAAAPARAQATEVQRAEEQALARLGRFLDLVDELRSHIDRSQFDPEALLDRLDYDPARVVRFVGEGIYFEQYPGLLRGPQGTLASRAGNALDQSLLLATLLRDAGFEARILRGALPTSEASRLVQRMTESRSEPPAIGDVAAMRAVLRKMASLADLGDEVEEQLAAVGEPLELTDPQLREAARADTEYLLARLEEAGVTLGDPEALSRLVEEATDYYWVELREAASGPWQAVHPAFGAASTNAPDVTASATYTDEIPPGLQHRFRFEVVIEQQIGDRIEEKPILEGWERPIANLYGEPLTYTALPDGVSRETDPRKLESALENSRLFFPVLNVKELGKQAFDLNGMTAPVDAAASAAAGVFKSGADKMADAVSSLIDLGSADTSGAQPQRAVALRQQRLELTFISPGGAEKTYVRNSFRDDGPKTADLETKKRLGRNHTFMLAPGSYPQAYLLDRTLEQLVRNRPILEVQLAKAFAPDRKIELPANALADVDLRSLGHLGLYALFDLGAEGDLSYRPEASMAIVSEDLPTGEQGERITDIVRNHRRSFVVADGALKPAPEATLASGVWESHAERVPAGPGSESRFNTGVAFAAAREAGIEVVTILPQQVAAIAELEISELARANLRVDLESGYAVIVPRGTPPDTEGRTGWWRVDPRAGETVGVGDDGRGGDTVEELGIILLSVLITATAVATVGIYLVNKLTDAVLHIVDKVAFVIHCDSPGMVASSPACQE